MLVEPTPYSGVGAVEEGGTRWKASSAGFLTYTKSKDGELAEGHLGLIENVRDPDSRKVRDVVFDRNTGKPVAAPEEVWIVRDSKGAHTRLAESWGTSAVFFVDDLSPDGLAKAAKRRNFMKGKIDAQSTEQCSRITGAADQ